MISFIRYNVEVMRIAIDLSQINRDGAGVNNYLKGVLNSLLHNSEHEFVLCMRQHEVLNFDLPENASILVQPSVPKWQGGGFIWYWLLGRQLREKDVDILLEVTMNTACVFFPTLQVIHDLSPITHPQTVTGGLRWRFWLSLWFARLFATKIAALTETTKLAFKKKFPGYEKPIIVTDAGLAEWTKTAIDLDQQAKVSRKLKLPKKYFFSLGTVQPRKNYQQTVKAFAQAIKTYPDLADFHYLIGGGTGWLYGQILAEAQELGVEKKVRFLGFLEEEDLPHIFDQSAGFVQTSIEEGFGLPLIEARSRGLPILCSDIPVFRHIEFDSDPIFVDPTDINDMAQGFAELAKQPKSPPHQALIETYSWDNVAQRIVDFITAE